MPHEFEWDNDTKLTVIDQQNECIHKNFVLDTDFQDIEHCVGNSDDDCTWARAIHLNGPCNMHISSKMHLFDEIEPDDICQGALGDCWLLSAISGLTEYPDFIYGTTFMGNRNLNEDGNYTIKLYDVAKKDWVKIKIDDKIPCKKRKWYEEKYKPLFSQPKDNEFYVLLIEKAFAKYAGS